jgi:hypothetical protein
MFVTVMREAVKNAGCRKARCPLSRIIEKQRK